MGVRLDSSAAKERSSCLMDDWSYSGGLVELEAGEEEEGDEDDEEDGLLVDEKREGCCREDKRGDGVCWGRLVMRELFWRCLRKRARAEAVGADRSWFREKVVHLVASSAGESCSSAHIVPHSPTNSRGSSWLIAWNSSRIRPASTPPPPPPYNSSIPISSVSIFLVSFLERTRNPSPLQTIFVLKINNYSDWI